MHKIQTCRELRPVELRLIDCLSMLCEARKHYFDPDQFRMHLNNLIQATRNVTWILQSNKAKFEDYENWYASWQTKMRDDSTLKWLNEARIEVVKRGDLEAHSVLHVSLVESWLSNPIFEIEINPSLNSKELIEGFAKSVPKDMPLNVGLLRVERRWVDSKLPEVELLGAISHVLEVISELISDAHSHLKNKNPTEVCSWASSVNTSKQIRKVLNEWDRTAWYALKEGKIVEIDVSEIEDRSLPSKEETYTRYPEIKSLHKRTKTEHSFKDKVFWFYCNAKILLAKDKRHDPFAFVGLPSKGMIMVNMPFGNRMEKHLAMEALKDIVKKEKAVSVITIGEFWFANPSEPYKLGYTELESKHRGEILVVAGITSSREAYNYSVTFSRGANNEIVFGEETETTGEIPNFLKPIHELWEGK